MAGPHQCATTVWGAMVGGLNRRPVPGHPFEGVPMTLVFERLPIPPPDAAPADADRDADWDIVDEWGLQSFPASDPPSNW